MSISLTYLNDLGRVKIEASFDPSFTHAHIERTINVIKWTTVRGGQNVTLSNGSLLHYDYEFEDGVENTYRVTPNSGGNLLSANQASLETDTSGWVSGGSTAIIARTEADSLHGTASLELKSAPEGFILRSPATTSPSPTPVTQGQAYTAVASFKAATDASGTEIAILWLDEFDSVIDDVVSSNVADNTSTWTQRSVTGVAPAGAAKAFVYVAITLPGNNRIHYIDEIGFWEGTETEWSLPAVAETDSITPTLDAIWLKSPSRPFLNRRIVVHEYYEIERPARHGVFDVIGRSAPIAVTDVRGSRQFEMGIRTNTEDEANDLDYLLASGDVLFIHVPANRRYPQLYAAVGNTSVRLKDQDQSIRYWTLPITEVVAPSPVIAGVTVTWQTIVNDFADWADVIATFPTWADVLDYVADPGEVIVE